MKKRKGMHSGLIAGCMAMALAVGSGGNPVFAAGNGNMAGDVSTAPVSSAIHSAAPDVAQGAQAGESADIDIALIDVAQDDLDEETLAAVVRELEKFTTPDKSEETPSSDDPEVLKAIVEMEQIEPVPINETTFPDPAFRAVISSSVYDQDGNGILDPVEIYWTYNIHCEYQGVRSLKGAEYFVNLQGLWCRRNNITEIDVTPFKDLRGLWCSENPISEIDISQNPELVWIYCFDCDLSELDVSHNPHMAYIEINTNPKLKEMDVTMCDELEHFTIGTCDLQRIDLSNNPNLTHLDIFQNPRLESLDLSKNTGLKRLDIWNNPLLSNVDISHNQDLQYYNCAYNKVKELNLSNNTELTSLNVAYNHELTRLDVSMLPKLSVLHCEDCAIESIDLKNNPQLRFFYGAMNRFDYVDFGHNPSLIKTIKDGKYDCEDFWTDEQKQEAFENAGKIGTPDAPEGRPICWYGQEWILDFGGDDSTGGDHIFTVWLNIDCEYSIEPYGDFGVKEQYSPLDQGVDAKDLLTREIAIQAIYEMAGRPSVAGLSTRFTDIPAGSPYYNAIVWAENNAIAMGYPGFGDTNFGFGKWLTRQDFMFMLMRYVELMPQYEDKRAIDFGRSDSYEDYFDVDYDHWEAVCWNATWDIVAAKGKTAGAKEEQRIDPFGIVTETEFNNAVNRMIEVLIPIPSNFRKWNPPEAPQGLNAIAPSAAGASDGKITGVDKTMEYSTTPDFSANVRTCTSNTISGLKAGTYYVRIKELDHQNPGHVTVVVVSDLIDWNAERKSVSAVPTVKPTTAPGSIFPDVPDNAWFAGAVKFVFERGYVKGKEKNGVLYYGPNDTITRAEFATILYSKEKNPQVRYTAQFDDVKEGKWFTNPILWAYENDLVKGYGNSNRFGVSDSITREQIAQILYKYAKMLRYDLGTGTEDLKRFSDAKKVSSWAETAMKWAVSKGVINGTGDGRLNPKGNATRAECAAMISSFVKHFEGEN